MQIKSWQIAAIGTLAQFLIGVPLMSYTLGIFIDAGTSLLILIILIIVLGGIPTLLLSINKTKKLGAIVSMISFFIIIYLGFLTFQEESDDKIGILTEWFFVIGILGFFILASGIHYFRKKV